jgi:two-component system, OmpR family, response regulator
MRVLLIEDEPNLGEAVREQIVGDAHSVDWFMRLDEAADALAAVPYELILLDLHLPDGRGLDLLRHLRQRGDATPVIIITARDQISDRIEGLNAGADDYLVKPFNLDELSARVHAVARRYAGSPNPVVKIGDIEINQTKHQARVHGKPVDLTSREWAVLDQFLRHPSAVVSKRQIEDALYAFGAEVESNTVEVYVSRLRKKLGRGIVQTVRGIGYRFER